MNTTTLRKFIGTVDSASPAFHGIKAPATLTLIDLGDSYECRFVFVVGESLTLTVLTPEGQRQ